MYNPGVNKVKLIIVFLLSVSISVEGFYLLSNIYYLIFIAKSVLFFVFVNGRIVNGNCVNGRIREIL